MSKILLHIGTTKTGSTSIQAALHRHASRLRKLGVIYPQLGQQPHHHDLCVVYNPYESLPRGTKRRCGEIGLDRMRADYASQFHRALTNARHIIISGESLYKLTNDAIADLKADLSRFGYRHVKVLIYVREPASFYLSAVQQRLKASSSFAPPQTFRYPFEDAVNRWSHHFPEELEVRPFAKEAFPRGCVIRDFLGVASAYFAVELNPDDFSVGLANQSVSAEGMIFLQQYRRQIYPDQDNIVTSDSYPLVRLLEASREELEQTPPTLKPYFSKIVRQNHREGLRRLKTEYGVELPGASDIPDAALDNNESRQLDLSRHPGGTDEWPVQEILADYDEHVLDRLRWLILRKSLNAH